jgi:hypothetical protein
MTKLADLRANATYASMSVESLNEMRKSNNAKNVFDCLDFDYNDKCYSLSADSILKAVKIHSEGFVVDIATRFSDPSNKFEMSQKQAWCVAYAFCKIKNELGNEII